MDMGPACQVVVMPCATNEQWASVTGSLSRRAVQGQFHCFKAPSGYSLTLGRPVSAHFSISSLAYRAGGTTVAQKRQHGCEPSGPKIWGPGNGDHLHPDLPRQLLPEWPEMHQVRRNKPNKPGQNRGPSVSKENSQDVFFLATADSEATLHRRRLKHFMFSGMAQRKHLEHIYRTLHCFAQAEAQGRMRRSIA